jgi:hypothetical protein
MPLYAPGDPRWSSIVSGPLSTLGALALGTLSLAFALAFRIVAGAWEVHLGGVCTSGVESCWRKHKARTPIRSSTSIEEPLAAVGSTTIVELKLRCLLLKVATSSIDSKVHLLQKTKVPHHDMVREIVHGRHWLGARPLATATVFLLVAIHTL